jgi:hypothetical protein
MSRTLWRCTSWLATAALLTAVGLALRHLPGAGGLTGEVRWLLSRRAVNGPPIPAPANPVLKLLILRESREPGATAGILGTLLSDRDPRVVDGVLSLAFDLRAQSVEGLPRLTGFWPEFRRWFHNADLSTKQLHREGLVRLLAAELHADDDAELSKTSAEDYHRRPRPGASPAGLELTNLDLRWILLATLARDRRTAVPALNVCLRAESFAIRDIIQTRLELLDRPAGGPWGGACPPPWSHDCLREHAATWSTIELTIADELSELVRDPDADLRWAAGRILAVCRDRRGLPAVHERLRDRPREMQEADRLMQDLFGPDWREALESGSATRQ